MAAYLQMATVSTQRIHIDITVQHQAVCAICGRNIRLLAAIIICAKKMQQQPPKSKAFLEYTRDAAKFLASLFKDLHKDIVKDISMMGLYRITVIAGAMLFFAKQAQSSKDSFPDWQFFLIKTIFSSLGH